MIFIYILLGVTLIQYQNCAPSVESLDQELALPVDGIDEVFVGEISFQQNKVSAFMDQSVIVSGVCEQAGALISWKLIGSNDEVIERGLAPCESGSFEVSLSDQWQNYCADDLRVEAALGAQAQSEVTVEGNCL